ncbi:hypothetical protein PLICRDRAFT_92383 [Plicaturopsis crispa FD-325 SS-3]|nr:hypothetical protein PLICRDRAFT_92383 [Plicaturopsis crispa FD-325 SS-3]
MTATVSAKSMAMGAYLPAPVFRRSILSIILSVLVFIFSILDLGTLSYWLLPLSAFLTVLYHSILLHLARHDYTHHIASNTYPKSMYLAHYKAQENFYFLGFLELLWCAAIGVAIWIAVAVNTPVVSGDYFILASALGTQIASIALAGAEVLAIAFYWYGCYRSLGLEVADEGHWHEQTPSGEKV